MAAIRIYTPKDHVDAIGKAMGNTMVFVDGTNLFYRLRGARLRVPAFEPLFRSVVQGKLVRAYLYTITPHHEAAVKIHGADCFDGIRVVFGTAVPRQDGNYKEKGVDALLVADLVYHAASRNCDHVAVVSTDADFVHALQRVEDFGCVTAVLAVCAEAPTALQRSCDRYVFLSRKQLLEHGLAAEVEHLAGEKA